jgi:hypothetical protein
MEVTVLVCVVLEDSNPTRPIFHLAVIGVSPSEKQSSSNSHLEGDYLKV